MDSNYIWIFSSTVANLQNQLVQLFVNGSVIHKSYSGIKFLVSLVAASNASDYDIGFESSRKIDSF